MFENDLKICRYQNLSYETLKLLHKIERIYFKNISSMFQPFTYPEEAGLPIGGPKFSRYVMLEVHYNNPELKEGI